MPTREQLARGNLFEDPVLIVASDGQIEACNPAFAGLFGLAAQDLAGRRLSDLTAISAKTVERYLRTCARSVKARPGSVIFQHQSARLPFRMRGVALPSNGPSQAARVFLCLQPAPARGTARARSLARDAQTRDEHAHEGGHPGKVWLAAIVESSDDAVIGVSLNGIVVSWNAAAARLFGFEPEEILGQPNATIIPPELHREDKEMLARIRRGEHIEPFDTLRMSRDGRRIEVSITVSAVRDEHGEIIGVSKSLRDISRRKESERLVREADHRKDVFLGTLDHELRNALASVQNGVEILSRADSLRPLQRTACDILERQVRVLSHLTDDLRDISRLTSGRLKLREEPLELSELLEQSIESLRPELESKQQTIALTLPDVAIGVFGDRIRLTQVFSNLLDNAHKYTPAGGNIQVVLTVESGSALVCVCDNGIGIAPELLARVFEPFFQIGRLEERGLGIGLTLARRLVHMHGGSIEGRSEGPDRGSEFIVRLPICNTPGMAESARSPLRAQRSRRVLIADDNADAAASLALLLKMMGHETLVAHDGLAAVESAERFRPAVMLVDLAMPKLDGWEVARQILLRPWASEICLIAVTGFDRQEQIERSKEAGFHRHLVKPVRADVLLEILDAESTAPPGEG
jgi:PAS domain S-box-containing protein